MNDSDRPVEVAAGAGGGFTGRLLTYDDFPAALEPATDAPAAKLVSLRYIGAAIKRSKVLWCVSAALGLLLGSALFVSTKPTYQVTVSILIANNSSVDPVSQMQTNALLAQAPSLGATLVKQLGLNETPAHFVESYAVTVVNNQLITIAVSDPSANIATSRAIAVADGFMQFRAASLREQQSAVFTAEDQQVSQEEQAVSALDKQISQVSAGSAAAGDGSSLAELRTKSAKATATLSALEQQVATSQAAQRILTNSMISGTDVLNVSYPALLHSKKKTAIQYIGGGLLGGLVVGMGIVAIRAITSDRLRRRSDVAEALGAPVRISVAAGDTAGRSLPGLGRRGKPNGEMNRVVRYLRNALPANSRGAATLAVVSVDNAKAAASIVADLAVACAREGKRVFVADLSGGALADQLGVAEPGIQAVTVNQERIVLAVPAPRDVAPIGPLSRAASIASASDGIAMAYSGADILIALATLDPAVGADHLSTWTNEAVAVVTAGVSTTVKIHAAGEMIRGAGIHLTSAVLLGADRNDESLGAVG